MVMPDKCPHCGEQPQAVCSEDNLDSSLQGMVLCFGCMKILSVSGVDDIRGRVSALLIDHAIQRHNTDCAENRN